MDMGVYGYRDFGAGMMLGQQRKNRPGQRARKAKCVRRLAFGGGFSL